MPAEILHGSRQWCRTVVIGSGKCEIHATTERCVAAGQQRVATAPEIVVGPRDNFLNRARLRHYVRQRDRVDRRARRHEGMATFPRDWTELQTVKAGGEKIPRIVWMLWLQGEKEAPPLVRAAIDSWRSLNEGWEVRVLNTQTVAEAIDLPTLPGELSAAHRADIIRLRLLAEYGGVWTDATTICLKPLDTWVDQAASGPLFAFAQPQPGRALANWFLASRSAEPLVDLWRHWSEGLIMRPRARAPYFWQHYTFEWMLAASADVRQAWARVPRLSARGPHVMQRLLDGHLQPSEMPDPAQMAELPLVKLSWKKGYQPGDVADMLARFDVAPPACLSQAS